MLAVPHGGPCFTFEADIFTGAAPVAADPGVQFTTSATAHNDGTAVTLLSALSRDACYLVLAFSNTSAAAADPGVLADVLVDPAGGTSWTDLISDLLIGGAADQAAGVGSNLYYHFPIWIPAGASIGVQARRANTGALTGRVNAWVYGEPKRPDQWWCGQAVESLGVTPASSKGTGHVPAAAGAYSTWATIGTSTKRYGALQLGIGGTDSNALNATTYWQMGVGSQLLPGAPTILTGTTTSETMSREGTQQPIWCDLPSGTALQVQAQGSAGAPGESHDVAFYGVY